MDVINTKSLIINNPLKSNCSKWHSHPRPQPGDKRHALTNSAYYFYLQLNRILPLIYVVIVRAGNTGNKATEQPTSGNLI